MPPARTRLWAYFGEDREDETRESGRMGRKLGFGEYCVRSMGCDAFREDREDREDVPNPHMGAREYGVGGGSVTSDMRPAILMCAFQLSSLSSPSSLKDRQSHEI